MKKNVSMKVITLATMVSFMAVAVCGCTSVETGNAELTETAKEEEIVEEADAPSVKAYAEWTVKDIAALKGIIYGITNRQYAAGEGAAHVIYGDINYDNEIVNAVQLNTASVLFDTLGEYGMNYWVYFNLPALTGWMAENGMDTALDGLDADADVLCMKVDATLLVTEGNPWTKDSAKEEEESTSASSSKSGSGSNTSSKTECDHNWVATEHYEPVLVEDEWDESVVDKNYYECCKCGYIFWDVGDSHCVPGVAHEWGSAYTLRHTYKTVHHDAVYEDKLVSITYKCSKCGATK